MHSVIKTLIVNIYIFRVVYPEDLDLRDPRSPDSKGTGLNSGLGSGSNRGRGRRGRPPKSNMRGGLGRGLDGTSGRRVGVNAGSVDMDFDEDRLILDDTAKVSSVLFYAI